MKIGVVVAGVVTGGLGFLLLDVRFRYLTGDPKVYFGDPKIVGDWCPQFFEWKKVCTL